MPSLISLIAALVLGQGAPAQRPPEDDKLLAAPILQAGTHASFQRAFLKVVEKLEQGAFDDAERLRGALPRLDFTLAWDDSELPANVRGLYAEARDKALKTWSGKFPKCEIKVVPFKKGATPAPGLAISFVKSIPPQAEDPMPPGAVHFYSDDPAEPRVECVISLSRGRPSVPVDFVDVHNEVAYALSQYYGIERSLTFGAFSARTDVPAASLVQPGLSDLTLAKGNVDAVEKLGQAIQKKQRMAATRPEIHIDPLVLDAGEANQGDLVPLRIQITNNGSGPLHIRAMPDCSCVSVMRGGMLAPGETRAFPAQIDLTEVVGLLDKSIVVYSNDFDKTVTRIPVRVRSKPLYRLIAENDGFVVVEKGGVTHKVYLLIPEGFAMKPRSAFFQGIEATVTFKPWSGTLADPELNEPPASRKGYVFEIKIPDEVPPGQTIGNLFIDTDHPKLSRLQANLVLQSGIQALPDQIYYGEIPAAPRRSIFLLSRPLKGFKIVSASADTPFFKVSFEPTKSNWEYRFTVLFDGKAVSGPLASIITIKTDDPRQPEIRVPITASIR